MSDAPQLHCLADSTSRALIANPHARPPRSGQLGGNHPCTPAPSWSFQPMRQLHGERSLRTGSSTTQGESAVHNETRETAFEQTASIGVMAGPQTAILQRAMEPFAVAPGDGRSVGNPTGGVTTFKRV